MVLSRRNAHLGFLGAVSLCVVLLAVDAWRLQHAVRVEKAVAAADSWARQPSHDDLKLDRYVALARAVALSKAGETDAALRGFSALQVDIDDEVSRAAMFDVGNLHLRQALREPEHSTSFLPLLELAKQRYRDVLRADPANWDARFNLERALRLAPEDKEAFEEPVDRPIDRPPNKLPELLAPDLP